MTKWDETERDTDADEPVCAIKLHQAEEPSPAEATRELARRMDELHQLSLMLYRPTDADYCPPRRASAVEERPRQFARCAVPDEGRSGTLSVRGRRWSCRVTELSIGGFGVVTSKSSQLTPGALGSLRTGNLNYVVQVTRIEERPQGVFVGLKQIEEVVDEHARLPGEPTVTTSGYLIAALSGVGLAALAFVLMNAFS